MKHCGIVLVRHLQDCDGDPCNGSANSECSDCGITLCDLHQEECELCNESFCNCCYLFHMEKPHSKPSVGSHQKVIRRSALG
jgi:hypothetical protein